MTIRLASLDMAGTTLDEGGIVYDLLRETVEGELGDRIPDDVFGRWTGTGKREAIEGLLSELGGDTTRTDDLFAGFSRRLDDAYRDRPAVALAGVEAAMAALRADGVSVVLQTGYTREVAQSLLDAVGWGVGSTIDALVTSDDVSASRPAPYLVFRSMEVVGVRSVSEVLVAGDTPNDLGAGMSAGAAMVVGVLSGASSARELGRHPHTHLVDSVADLPDLLMSRR